MKNTLSRRMVLSACAITLAAALGTAPAQAQDFPNGPITLVVTWPAGGGSDRAGRLLAEYGEKYAGVPIVVNNVPGAGGSTGVRFAADAAPDGQTVLLVGSSLIAQQYINPAAPSVDSIRPLAFFGPDSGSLMVRADTGIESVEEFVAALKENPGSIKNGNDSPGGWSYVVAALIEKAAGVEMTKVPYQGYAPTVAAIMAGEVQSTTMPVHQLVDQAAMGDINILAVTAEGRHFMTPDVPTFRELGIDLVAGDFRAVFVPAATPDDIAAKLEEIFLATLNDPEFQEAAKTAGFVITPKNAEETAAFLESFDNDYYGVLESADLVRANKR